MPSTRVADFRARFYEEYATTQGNLNVNEATMARVLRQDILPLVTGPEVLDIGCGRGVLVRELAKAGHTALGIETSPEMAAIAVGSGARVVEAEALTFLQANQARFDTIVATDLIEHFDKDAVVALFDAVFAALKPGGVFVGRTPNGASPFAGRYRYGDFTHGLSYTARSIAQIAAVTGFTDTTVRGCEPVGKGLVGFVRRAVWRAYEFFFRVALAAETGIPPRGHIVTQNLVFRLERG